MRRFEALARTGAPAHLFDDRERAAFNFADEVLDPSGSTAETFATVRQMFLPRELVELLLLLLPHDQ